VEVTVVLEPEPGTDPEDRERLGRQLQDELRALDVDDVSTIEGGPPPEGEPSGGGAAGTGWLVTLSAGGGVFVTVIATLKDWLARRSEAHTVTVTIAGDTLELSAATPVERAELIEAFVRRHRSG
jgi:hypothetical protein